VIAYLSSCREWHDVKHSKTQIEELLIFLKAHCEKIDDILPYLPVQLKEDLTSEDFVVHCMEDFQLLDKAQTGVLEPREVVPLILQLTEAHHLALTFEHVLEFVDLFDTARNGVINPSEYVNFSRFMMILAYLETEEGQLVKECADISAGVRRVDELLTMLQQSRDALHKVIPLLPEDVFNSVTGDAFIVQCEEQFAALDLDKNGVLEPKELFPIVVELSKAHPYAIDHEHCRQFTSIFDIHGDGVIRKDEFVDFARFLCVMSYLHSEEGVQKVGDALKIMSGSQRIDDLLKTLQRDRHELRKVIPYLPEALRDEIISAQFADNCRAKFLELDKNKQGFLGPLELIPTILDMTGAHRYAIDERQCKRFIAIFDDEKTGVISLSEYVNFARFIMVMSFLQTEDGKVVLDLALDAQNRQSKREQDLQILPADKTLTKTKSQSPSRGATSADMGHMKVDLDYYQNKAKKLASENDRLREDMFRMQESMRRMESRMEEQEQRLRHAEIDLKNAGRR
jgi:Ca2+-binding EF-hand superfamily protein